MGALGAALGIPIEARSGILHESKVHFVAIYMRKLCSTTIPLEETYDHVIDGG